MKEQPKRIFDSRTGRRGGRKWYSDVSQDGYKDSATIYIAGFQLFIIS